MNRDYADIIEPEKYSSAKEYMVDSPEDFRNSHNECEDTTPSEPYCRWLDDLGWI